MSKAGLYVEQPRDLDVELFGYDFFIGEIPLVEASIDHSIQYRQQALSYR